MKTFFYAFLSAISLMVGLVVVQTAEAQSYLQAAACYLSGSNTACLKTVNVASGGTGLASGTSGGVLAYTASGTLASSAALTANGIVLGGGAGVVPSVTAACTTANQVLRAGSPPACGALVVADLPGPAATSVSGYLSSTDWVTFNNKGLATTSSSSSNSPNQATPSEDTFYDVASVTITPPSGTIDIRFHCFIAATITAGLATTSAYTRVAIRSGSSTVEQTFGGNTVDEPVLNQTISAFTGVSGTFQTTTDGTKTYKLSIKWNSLSGSPTVTPISCRGDQATTFLSYALVK